MDPFKVFTILTFFAGIAVILVASGFAVLSMVDRVRRKQAEWQQIAHAGTLTGELDELRARVEDLERRGLASGEVEAQYARVAELEERLDFTERLLAQRQDVPQLPSHRTPA
jgi:hypothetical protein